MADRSWRALSWTALALAVVRVLSTQRTLGGDTLEYVAGADALLGDGSYSTIRYPPGFPLLLAPFRVLDLPVWWLGAASGVALVVLIWRFAVVLKGHHAGVIAGLLCSLSPLIYGAGRTVMADTPAVVAVLVALLFVEAGRWRLAGVALACSGWLRLGHVAFLVTAPRVRMLVAGGVALVPLVAFNLLVFGTLSGYDGEQASWSLDYFWQGEALHGMRNPTPYGGGFLYPALLMGKASVLVPLLPIPAAVEMWVRRREPATRLAVGVVALNVFLYAFYFYQSFRFILPAAALVVVYGAAGLGRAIGAASGVHLGDQGPPPRFEADDTGGANTDDRQLILRIRRSA